MEQLPTEMVGEVVSHLPRSSLYGVSCVSRMFLRVSLVRVTKVDTLEGVTALCSSGDELSLRENTINRKDSTLLHYWQIGLYYASSRGHIRFTQKLAKRLSGSSVGVDPYDGRWAMRGLAESGNIELIHSFYRKGVPIETALYGLVTRRQYKLTEDQERADREFFDWSCERLGAAPYNLQLLVACARRWPDHIHRLIKMCVEPKWRLNYEFLANGVNYTMVGHMHSGVTTICLPFFKIACLGGSDLLIAAMRELWSEKSCEDATCWCGHSINTHQ